MNFSNNNPSVGLMTFFVLALAVAFGSAHAADQHHAKQVAVDVADYMVSGESYPVRIEFKNDGTSVWNADKGFRIGWADPALQAQWGEAKFSSLFDVAVAPGETAVVEFEIVAPQQAGRFQLGWQLLDENGAAFAEPALVQGVRVESANNQSRVMMQLVPDQVAPGSAFNAVIQIKNIGRTTWSGDSGYHLAALESAGWSVKRLDFDPTTRIAPGESVTFKAAFEAPAAAGVYPFQWQMRQQQTFFGDRTAPVAVRVAGQTVAKQVSSAEFVYQEVAKTLLSGEPHEVTLQFKNSGQTPWQAGQVALVSPDDSALLWAVDTVELRPVEVIKPGGFAVFRFNIQAPLEPGLYPFQWQLRDLRQGLFGEPSEALRLEVK